MRTVVYRRVKQALEEGRRLVLAVQSTGDGVGRELLVTPEGREGSLDPEELDEVVLRDARSMLDWEFAGTRRYSTAVGEVEVFFRSFVPRPLFYIFGAVNASEPLSKVASVLGYEVVVCDARAPLVSRERFPDADRVVVGWPHEVLEGGDLDVRTCVCILTHDPKFDLPALEVALAGPAGYIGALGSKRTHEQRLRELRARGVSDEALARIHAPIGLDLGASTPAEIAVAIAAEAVSVRSRLRPR